MRIILLTTSTGELTMTKSIEKEITTEAFEIHDEITQQFIVAVDDYYSNIFRK